MINDNSDAEAYSEAKIIGDESCRYIPSGKYGYFKVDDEFPSDKNNLIFIIACFFYSTRKGILELFQYDQNLLVFHKGHG